MTDRESSVGSGTHWGAETARMKARAGLTRAIDGVDERSSFIQRVAQIVAAASNQRSLAVYSRSRPGDELALRAGTISSNRRLPYRLSIDQERALLDSATTGSTVAIEPGGPAALVAPLADRREIVGLIVALSESGAAFGLHDAEMLRAAADEVAGSIAIAERHHLLKQSSVVDPETGVAPAWYLHQRLDEETARAQRTNRPFGVVSISVVNVQELRAWLGYERADELLREIAGELWAAVRVFDVVARRRDGEYAVMLPECDAAGAFAAAQRLVERTLHLIERVVGTGGDRPLARVAGGSASFPDDGDRAAALLLAAEHRCDADARRSPWLTHAT